MIEGRLGRRYGRALFQLAREQGQEEQVGHEIAQFCTIYSESDLQKALANPAVALATRRTILNQVTERLQLAPLTVKFVSLLLERDRMTHLPSIVSSYRRLLNEAKGRVDARVVSASALDQPAAEQLGQRLRGISGKEVVIRQETDPELLGGVWIELEGKVYDGSIRTQLENMKQRIARVY